MSAKLNNVWDMIDSLEPNEKRLIYKKLKDDIRFKMNDILDTVNERVGNEPVELSEITKEVEDVRGASHGTH